MPRKITAYACQYKCGHRINSKKDSIERHETRCFSNPVRRACKTCHQFDMDEDGTYCNKDRLKEDQYAASDCKWWELKGD